MNKITITVSFPAGATFYKSPNLLLYNKFLTFLKNITGGHEEKESQFYSFTGEGLKKIPSIFFKILPFDQLNFKKNDRLVIEVFLLEHELILTEYLRIFFQEHLKQMMFRNFFYLVDFKSVEYINQKKTYQYLKLRTPVKDTFQDSYNYLIKELNQKLNTEYSLLSNVKETVKLKTNFGKVALLNKDYYIQGKLIEVYDAAVESIIFEIGIGSLCFIGGGQLEIID